MKSNLRLAAAGAAAFLAGCGARGERIAIYHTGSIHGRFEARPESGTGRRVGGFAALAKAVASRPGPRLLVDSGNWFQGTPEGMLSKGRAAVELMNAAGYDAAGLGQHEFLFGQSNLKELAGTARFPVLGTNLYETKTGERPAYLKAGVIKDVGGVKIGLLALLPRRLPLLTDPRNIQGLEVRPEAEEATKEAAELRRQGATIIVALSHLGLESPDQPAFEGDQALARNAEGLDLIVGERCPKGQGAWREPAKGTLVVCTGGNLAEAGRVDLEVDPATGKLLSSEPALVPLDVSTVGQDEAVLDAVKAWKEKTAKEMEAVVATASSRLARSRWTESAAGDWIADCLREAGRTEAAFINSGAVRSDLPEGPVTRRALFELMPFDDDLVTMRMSGRQIREALEHGVSGRHGVLQVSGVALTYDPAALPGQRVLSVELGGKPLKDERAYTVSVNAYLADGGDGFSSFIGAADVKDRRRTVRDVLEGCARKVSRLAPPASGRLKTASL